MVVAANVDLSNLCYIGETVFQAERRCYTCNLTKGILVINLFNIIDLYVLDECQDMALCLYCGSVDNHVLTFVHLSCMEVVDRHLCLHDCQIIGTSAVQTKGSVALPLHRPQPQSFPSSQVCISI